MTVPHFSFPFTFGDDGSVDVVEQDTYEEVEQNVVVLLLTQEGERVEVPSFGIRDLAFQVDFDKQAIVDAAVEWDERAEVLIEENPGFFQGMVRDVQIGIKEI